MCFLKAAIEVLFRRREGRNTIVSLYKIHYFDQDWSLRNLFISENLHLIECYGHADFQFPLKYHCILTSHSS
jgi:hypothetical protein